MSTRNRGAPVSILGREIEPLEQAGGQRRGPILSTNPASPAGLFVPVARTRPSIALCYPHLRGPLVSSYSPPPFVGSPPRCVFDPLRSWRRMEKLKVGAIVNKKHRIEVEAGGRTKGCNQPRMAKRLR